MLWWRGPKTYDLLRYFVKNEAYWLKELDKAV
jgi:hypothetical protein